MESSWRLNVFSYGLAGFSAFSVTGPSKQITLVSRIPGTTPANVITNSEILSSSVWCLILPPNMDAPYNLYPRLKTAGFPNFPYGWTVEPDVHG